MKIEEDNSDFRDLVSRNLNSVLNDGIALGMKESLMALIKFLETKVSKGYPEYITKTELQIYMKEYIELTVNELKK